MLLTEGVIELLNELAPAIQAGQNFDLGTYLKLLQGSLGPGDVAGSGITAEERGGGLVHQSVLTLAARSVAITDNGATGSGGSKLYDLPLGSILVLGTVVDLALTTTIAEDATVAAGIGQATAGADGTLATTEQDLIASTALTFEAGAAVWKKTSTGILVLDGLATAADVFLNFADTDDPGAGKVVVATGKIWLNWINLGQLA